MLQWIALLVGLGLLATAVALTVAMIRAERRARRSLYLALGVSEDTVELLMSRNSDVLASLALARMSATADTEFDGAEPEEAPAAPEPPTLHPRPAIRLVHPAIDEAPAFDAEGRQPHTDRHRRL